MFGYIYKQRIKIKNFLVDFDRHSRGTIHAEQFKSAIHGMVRQRSGPMHQRIICPSPRGHPLIRRLAFFPPQARIPLIPSQLDELTALYAEPDGRVNYRCLCALQHQDVAKRCSSTGTAAVTGN